MTVAGWKDPNCAPREKRDGAELLLAAACLQWGFRDSSLGQKLTQWTDEKNNELVDRMDVNGDGKVSKDEVSPTILRPVCHSDTLASLYKLNCENEHF